MPVHLGLCTGAASHRNWAAAHAICASSFLTSEFQPEWPFPGPDIALYSIQPRKQGPQESVQCGLEQSSWGPWAFQWACRAVSEAPWLCTMLGGGEMVGGHPRGSPSFLPSLSLTHSLSGSHCPGYIAPLIVSLALGHLSPMPTSATTIFFSAGQALACFGAPEPGRALHQTHYSLVHPSPVRRVLGWPQQKELRRQGWQRKQWGSWGTGGHWGTITLPRWSSWSHLWLLMADCPMHLTSTQGGMPPLPCPWYSTESNIKVKSVILDYYKPQLLFR